VIQWTYVDTCAAVKLFRKEEHSEAFDQWLIQNAANRPVTSDLTRTELRCALHRAKIDEAAWQRAELWIDHAALIRLGPPLFDAAGRLAPQEGLRSLDAIHVTAALQMESALAAFVTYDKRLAAAAASNGLPVVSPGAE
jgi:predicted nucleic acid-binding protein